MQDHRDELEKRPIAFLCRKVRDLFVQAGKELRAYKWAKKCGYEVD
jgi:hypothetical protein